MQTRSHTTPASVRLLRPLRRLLLASLTLGMVTGSVAWAQSNYPNRPVKLIIPFSAGGATDLIVRELAKGLTDIWGQPVVPENKPGASGVIAVETTARATPDGYTILLGSESFFSVLPFLNDKLPYNPLSDLKPTALVGAVPMILVAHPALKVKTLPEFVNAAKADTKGLDYASSGIGASHHMSMELLQRAAGIKLNHIAYKGGAPALQDVLAGHILVMWSAVSTALPHIKSGKLVALAVGSLERSPPLPNVPTVAESGLAGYEVTQWSGMLAPAATPPAIIARMNAEIDKILRKSLVRERLASDGAQPGGGSPEKFSAFIKADIAKWSKVVKNAGLVRQ